MQTACHIITFLLPAEPKSIPPENLLKATRNTQYRTRHRLCQRGSLKTDTTDQNPPKSPKNPNHQTQTNPQSGKIASSTDFDIPYGPLPSNFEKQFQYERFSSQIVEEWVFFSRHIAADQRHIPKAQPTSEPAFTDLFGCTETYLTWE
jgi:hypothetical protein